MRGVATSPCGCGVRRCRRAPCALGVLARIAVSLLVAVLAGAGLAVSASADVPVARGEVTGLEVASGAAGELTLRWTPPADPVGGPSEYRISWAPEGEDFRTWTDLDWNVFEAAPLSEYTITGLDREVAYKVRMRARYHAWIWASDPWSGPWAETAPVLASPDGVPQDDVPQDDVPQDDVPQDDVPQDDVPQDDVQQDDVQQDDVPQDDVQQDDVPQDDVPQDDVQQDDVQQDDGQQDDGQQDDGQQDDGQQDDGQQDGEQQDGDVSASADVPVARGEVTGLEVASEASGELTLRWTPPADPVGGPSEYRISWAPEGEDFRTWTDLDWNVFEAAPLSEYTITGLDPGVAYKVRMRARYHAWIWASDPWSGPWVETDPVLAAPVEDEEQQEEDEGGEDGLPGHEQVALELDPPTPPLYDTLDPELNELVARSLASEFDDDGSNGTRSPGSDGSESRRVLVWTKPSAVKSVLGFLRNSGAAVRDPLEGDNVLVADVAVSLLPRLAGQQGVLRVQLEPELVARGDDGARVHGALNWQGASFGGAGTRIAIVDIAFGDYDATKIENSVLPRPAAIRCYTSVTQIVTTLAACGLSDSRDHGTVVTEFAYETAPDAEFYLLKVYGDSDVHASIPWLVENQIDVVNISFGCECWFGYGDGSTNKTTGAIAVFDELVEQGIAVSLAGGNDANKTWFGTGFNDPDADGWLDWVDGDECNTVTLDEGTTYSVIARWDDVWGGSSKDLDVYLANSAGSEVVASSTYRQIGRSTDDAYEQIIYRPTTTGDYCAAVKRNGDVSVGWVQVAFLGGVSSVERTSESHELVGPSDTKNPGVLMVGALDNRVSGNMALVSFSSRGPMPDGTIKPDIVGSGVIHSDARDGTVSGTSMAAPHVAGLMALVLQRHPWFTPQQIASHLKDNALPRPNAASSPNNEWGHGLAFLPGEPASGSAVIAGLPEVGATLRASLSGHSEPDSPAGANSYRWLRVRDGATEEIAQATSASYTAAAADVGAQLRVRVRYTDHVDYVEEFLSDSTEVVQPQPDVFASSLAQSDTSTEVDLVAGGRVAQRFGTGARGSFALERIELQTAVALSAGSAYTVKLHAADPDKTNEPGTAVVTLEGTLEAVGTRVFTPQSPTELDAGSQYWVVVEVTSVAGSPSSQGRLAYKTGTSGLTLATGWALPASSLRRSQGETGWTTVSERVGLAVKGYVSASAPTFSATRYPGGAVVRTVDENTSSGNVGAAVTATDPNNRTLAYSVAATGDSDAAAHLAAFGHHFELDAATGQVSVRAAAAIDYETRASYKVKYQVTDSVDSAGSVDTAIDDTITLTVDVVNIDEPATVTLTGATSPAVGTELTASVADPDGIVSGTTTAYQWSRSARPDTGFADITDADAASYTPVAADTDMFLRAKATYTDFHGVGRTAHGVTSSAVGVTAAPLVQNFENLSGSAGYTPPTGEEIFQGFTTGDNPAGYLLSEIRVQLPLADTAARAEIWSSSRNSEGVDLPDERLVDLVSPATRTAGVKASFTAPAGVVLAPGTTYFVMFAGTTGVFVASSTDEDSGSSPGWSIGDKFLVQGADDNPGVFRQFSSRAGIAVHGAVVLGPPGPLSDVAVTPGAGEVTVTWSAPVIHGRRAVTKYEVRHRVASEPEWAYGAWSDVADSADAGTDLHDERSATITGLAGGTAYTFEVRAVNSRGGGTGAEASATPAVSVDRPGVVSFSAGLAVGTALTASLADPDTVSGTPTWQWARSATPDPGFVDITDADAGSYTPVEDDRAYFLRATVSYTDGHGAGKSASAVTALPVGVTARVLAKNTDQRSTGSQAYSNALVTLTAGSSPGGYGLSRVGIEFVSGTVTSPGAVEIKEYDNDQTAGDTLAVLVPPESLQAGAVNYFTVPAPAGLRLSGKFMLSLADTTSIQLAARLGSVVDDGHADGWNIATAFYHSTGLALVRPRIVVEGFELLGRPGPPLSVAASAGTGEVMLSWSAPDSDGHRPVTKYQVRHRREGGFFLETGDWSDVADSDGDSELDDERSLTVSGLAGGTVHVFQVRAVNSLGDGAEAEVKATPRSHTAPMFAAVDYPGGAASRSVAENAMSGDVGLPIIASDADGDSLTYSVAATGESDAAAHLADFNRDFELDTASGQVSVKAGASIDFEDRSSYVVSYRVTDGEDAAGTAEGTPVIDDTVTLTVSVTNVDEAGAVTLSGTAQVGEVLTASVSDPDGSVSGEVWQWSKASTMSGTFTDISGAMSASYTVLAADEGEFLKAAATYTDGFGSGRSASATSAVVAAAVPSVPVFGLGAGTVQVDSLAETLDGFTDFGGSAFAQWFTTGGSASDSFVVRGVRVPLAVGSGASVGVSVWTSDSLYSEGLPDAMVGGLGLVGSLDGDRSTVEEFVSASGVVLSGDTTYWLVFSNTGDENGSVQVPYLQPTGSFRDADTLWSLYVDVVFDEGKEGDESDWVDDGEGRPLALAIVGDPQRSVAENSTSGTVGALVVASDADGDSLTYSVAATSETDGAAHLTAFDRDFLLDASSGQVSVKSGAAIDYEDRREYRVLYRVTDGEDSSGAAEGTPTIDDEVTLTIRVTNADEAGTVTIAGTPQAGEELTARVSDPDGSVSDDVWVWSKSQTRSGTFTDIAGADSESYTPTPDDVGMFLRAAATYDDGSGSGRTASAVTAEAVAAAAATVPVFAAVDYPGGAASRSVAENTTSGDVGLPVAATDADGDSLTYSVAATGDTDAAAHLAAFNQDFELDTASGQISVKSGGSIDFEDRSSYVVSYQVTDGEDSSGSMQSVATVDDMVTLTITVTNVGEAGTVTISGTPQVGKTLTASVSDPDGSVSAEVWVWSSSATSTGTFDPISGAMSASYMPVAADVGRFLKATVTYTDGFDADNASATTGAVAAAAGVAAIVLSEDPSLAVVEGSSADVTVALATRPTADVTVTVTGHSGTDLTLGSDRLTFTATDWDDAQTVTVSAGEDDDTADENVALTFTAAGGGYAGVTKTLDVAVADDDPDVTVSFGSAAHSVTEGASQAVTVSLSAAPNRDVVVPLAVSGTATATTDFTGVPMSLTFGASETSKTFTVAAVDDRDADDGETVIVSLGSPLPAGVSAGTPQSTTVTITDNDTAGIVLSADPSLAVVEGSSADVTVALATRPTADVTVTVTGHSGTDLTLGSDRLTFTATDWDDAQTVTVSAGEDDDTADENVALTFTAAGGGYAGVTKTLDVAVADDDPDVTVSFGSAAHSVTEGASQAVTVSLSAAPNRDVVVPLAVSGTATATTDFTGVPMSLTFGASETSKTFTVAAVDDRDADDGETVIVSLGSPLPAGVSAGTPQSTTVTITDNDTAGIVLSADPSLAVVEGSSADVTVALATRPTADVTVTVTGHSGTDLTLGSDRLTFTATDWDDAQTVTVSAAEDGDTADENVALTFTAAGGGYAGVTKTLDVAVADDDPDVTVSFGSAAHSVTEGASQAVTVSLSAAPNRDVVVPLAVSGTATATTDFTGVPMSLTFGASETSKTFTVAAVDDRDADDGETVIVSLGSPLPAGVSAGTPQSTTVTITDNDATVSNTAPSFTSATVARSVVENTSSGDVGGAVAATDPESDSLTYSVAATGDTDAAEHLTAFNADFELDTASGQVSVKSGGSIDYEGRTSYKVSVGVSDNKDSSGGADPSVDATTTLTVTVTDVEEAGTATISGTLSVGEALSASVSDPDGGVSGESWQWSRSPRPDTGFTSVGTSSAMYTTVDDDDDFFLRAGATYSDRRGSGKSASATTELPVGVTADTRVKNTGQGSTGTDDNGNSPLFQGFTTGDNPAGYVLSSVGLRLSGTDIGAVELHAKHSSNSNPGSRLAGLEDPDSKTANAVNTFTAPAGTVLEPNTTYFVAVSRRSGATVVPYAYTASDSEDSGAASGWSIASNALSFNSPNYFALANQILRIDIRGFDLLGPPGPVATFTATPGEESVALSWTEPGSTGHRAVTKYQVRHKETAGSFGAWADVADSDSDSDLSDELSVTVSGLTGGTDYTFEVRAVNARGDGTEAEVTATPTAVSHTVPVFSAATEARSVAENTSSGVVGLAVTATDADGDDLTYSVAATGDTDAAEHLAAFNQDFELDTASGQVSVKSGGSIDFEDRSSYKVSYRVTDGEDAAGATESVATIDDMLTLTVSVTNVDEAGTVTLVGTAQVGETVTASVSDLDGSVSAVVWQWSKASTMAGSFNAISGAMSASYTVLAADEGEFLRAAATYSDGFGAGRSANATSTVVLAAAVVPTVPVFSAATEARSVAENATSGDVGLAVTATDADGDDLTYSVAATGDTDAAEHLAAFNRDFELDTASGQVSVKAGGSIDFEDRSSYVVSYRVTDGEDATGATESTATIDAMLTLTVSVTNVDEAGTVTLSGTAQVRQTLTASVSDLDGSVSSVVWQWSKASTMSGSFTAVADAMSASYVPVAADVGEFLKATATYVDGFGSGRSASATSTVVLAAAAEPTAPAGTVAIAGTAQLDQPLTAAVSRSVDVVLGTLLWSWSRSPRPDSGFTAITDANMAEYTPVAEDLGFFLRATATYTDGGGNQTAIAATALPVGITQRALAHNELRSYLEWESAPPGGWLEMLFQTGDNPAGYLLLDVKTVHHSSGGVDGVEIWQDPAGLLYTLLPQPPQRVDVILQPDTVYSLRLVGADAVGVNLGSSWLSSTGHAHGWRVGFIAGSPFIDDEHRLDPLYSIVDFLPGMAIVDFAGIELLGPPGPPTRVSAGAGAGAVTLSWSEPGSMGQNAIVKYQVRHKRSSQPDTAYSGWVDVADTHGDGDLSNERSVTVTGLTDGTAHTLQVRAVNGQGNGTAATVQATPGP